MNLTTSTDKYRSVIPFLIALLYLLIAIPQVLSDDITYDEQDHLNYGISMLKRNSSRQQAGADFNTTMPVTALNALPRAAEQLLNPQLERRDGGMQDTRSGRFVTISITLLLIGYAYLFASGIAGRFAGYWAMLLMALDPNILAHSHLVTTDLYSSLAFVATLYHLYQWRVHNQHRHFYYWCIAIALAQCCKINNILLYPVSIGIMIAYRRALPWKKTVSQLLYFVAIQILVINVCFLFYHTGMALHDYSLKSNFFRQIQGSWLGAIPLPLPQSFVDTYDLTQFERESFTGTASNYLLGELRYQKGFWNYYFVCWAVKTPLLTQILIVATITTAFLRKQYRKLSLVFFIVPSALILLLLSSSAVQGGYRYLLPVLCVALIASAVLMSTLLKKLPRYSAIGCCLILAIPVFMSFSNFLSYSSEWLWPKKNTYRYLADSNFNWGQRQKKILAILAQHPDYIFEPKEPVKGKIVVDINKLTGIIATGQFDWLRINFKPVELIEGCYLLYEVKQLP